MGHFRAADAFESKAAEYARYRADYPRAVIEWLAGFASLAPGMVVADLGAGTGMLSRHVLSRVARVHAVEPARDMRAAAVASLGAHAGFAAVAGSAEDTGLADGSVDAVVCGHAFHYFDAARARAEVERIARGRIPVAIVAYASLLEPSAFMQDYLRFIARVTPPHLADAHDEQRPLEQLRAFFRDDGFEQRDLGEVVYALSWDALSGRFASTSIAPTGGDPARADVLAELRAVFDAHASQGTVPFALRWTGAGGHVGAC